MAKEQDHNLVSAHDVAHKIMSSFPCSITTMKLQKLVYYCQAWSLVWDEAKLFQEKIEAWANGPIVPELYEIHRGQFKMSQWSLGNPNNLDANQQKTVQSVLNFYGDKSGLWLSSLTHQEDPWVKARKGLAPGERGDVEITIDSMYEYYGSLV